MQTILVAGRLDDGSPELAALGELAAALQAPLIISSYLRTSDRDSVSGTTTITNYDGLYAAMELAADLLGGAPLQSLTATFRLKTAEPGGFRSGSRFGESVFVEIDYCGMGCVAVEFPFVVTVP